MSKLSIHIFALLRLTYVVVIVQSITATARLDLLPAICSGFDAQVFLLVLILSSQQTLARHNMSSV